ncbi:MULTISPECIES: hypothetical protein [Streptomyces]|uniref:Uncharacterized protein n=1 Tax=Streptomyces virginiae TaxID=1961 RepID=A0ABZ1T314_STRVG|nr:hypothetical protein [Streptomyces virginiae]MDT0519195.1 hypothetical protein [Streptomyces sp. DSM 41633]
MRFFSVEGREYAALTVLGSDDFDALEVVEMTAAGRGALLLEFRMDEETATLVHLGAEVGIPLLRASLEIFRTDFLEPRRAAGLPLPPW